MSTRSELQQRRRAAQRFSENAAQRAAGIVVRTYHNYPSVRQKIKLDSVRLVQEDGVWFTQFLTRANGKEPTASPGVPSTIAEIELWHDLMLAKLKIMALERGDTIG